MLLALLAFAAGRPAETFAQAHHIAAAPEGKLETGAPYFSVRNHDSIGLDAPPTDLQVLPDGRLLLLAGAQFALGDGVRWETFLQSSDGARTAATALNVDAAGRVYVGTSDGFGRIEFAANGRWSAVPVAPWEAVRGGKFPVLRNAFQAGDRWFWHGDSGPLVAWEPGGEPRILARTDTVEHVFVHRERFYLSDRTNGQLLRLAEPRPVAVAFTDAVTASETITCSAPFSATETLVGTDARGLKLFDGERARPFAGRGVLAEEARINAICPVGADYFAAAIESVGIVFFDRTGRVVQTLDYTLDRHLRHVRKLRRLPSGDLVALLANGIARVEFPSRVSHFEPLFGSILETAHPYRLDGQLWVMADGNMHRAAYDAHGRLVEMVVDSPRADTKGGKKPFVFAFHTATGRPIASTDDGAYVRTAGGWKRFAPGTVNLRLLQTEPVAGRWLYSAKHEVGWLTPDGETFAVQSFPEPRLEAPYNAETDADGAVWIEQGNGRAARLFPRDGRIEVQPFSADHGLPEGWVQIFKTDDRVRFSVRGQILRYFPAAGRFAPDTDFTARFPAIREYGGRPIVDGRGRLWLLGDGAVHVFEARADGWHEVGERMPPGFEPYYFTCESDGVVWMHGARRLARFDPAMPAAPTPAVRAQLTRIAFTNSGRSVFAPGARLEPLGHEDNSLVAHFVASHCPFGTSVEFEVQLSGRNGGAAWVSAGGAGSAAFNRLEPGDYVLRVRPRLGDRFGEEAALEFAILPPWYRTGWAYTTYAAALLGLFGGSLWTSSYLQRRENARLEKLVAQRTAELNAGVERRLRLEAQLRQAQKLESLGTLAGGIAHDFNNLLTSILGYCELALLNGAENPALQGDLREIRQAGNRAKELVAQILTFSRKGTVKLAPLDLALPVAEALKLVRRSTPATIEIATSLASGPVSADATQVQQIVLNLCNNAIHAMRDRPGRLEVALAPVAIDAALAADLPGLEPGPAMRLTVRDSGHGMDAATLERIFDPFFTTKAQGEGTGLGLAIVQGIVQSHRGAIRVQSAPGRGTTFELFFPVSAERPAQSPAPAAEAPKGESEEVLVVDDERAVATFVARRLEQLGYRPVVFFDPRAALTNAQAAPGRFTAIVTDLTMPGLLGTELIEQVRASHPGLPAVIVTGYGTDKVRDTLRRLPRCVVLEKPFDGESLARALRDVLPGE